MSPFELGLALLTGRATKAWNARAIRGRALLAGAIGGAPPTAAFASPSPREAPEHALQMKLQPAERALAVEGAKLIVDALGRRRFDRLTDLLGPEVWVLWPNGSLLRHSRPALAEELQKREGERLPLKATDPKSYGYPELRLALARGVPEAYDAVLDLSGSTVVTIQLSGGRGPAGRVMFVMAPFDGKWLARSLALGSPDDAHVISGRMKDRDANDGAILGPVLRATILGQGAFVRASQQHLMPRLWLKDRLADAEQLATLADDGPHRLGCSELLFGRLKEVELKKLNQIAPKAGLPLLEAKAFEVFGEPLDALQPRLWTMELGVLDPSTQKIQPAPPVHGLVVRQEDGAGRPRPRIAGLYL